MQKEKKIIYIETKQWKRKIGNTTLHKSAN